MQLVANEAEVEDVAIERRHPPNHLQVVALLVSALGLILGPCFGAAVAVVGNYIASSTHSAVTDEKLSSIKVSVDKLVEQSEVRQKTDGKTEQILQEYDRRITEAKGLADQALARATNAQIDSKTRR